MENHEEMNIAGADQELRNTEKCANCGEILTEDQAFCPKCGMPRKKKNACSNCGADLQEGQEFCSKCGQKVGLGVDKKVVSAIDQFNADVDKQNRKKKKAPIIIGAVIVIVILAALAFKTVAPKIFISMEGYLEQGNYEKAYGKAKTDKEKLEVKAENAAAVQSAYSADNLKDPSSFSLRDAYYNEETNDDGMTRSLVLLISGANSYGANVSSYWLYDWDNEDQGWKYFTSVSDLDEEEYSEYDDDDEKLEKIVDNIGRMSIQIVINDGIKLSKSAIKRINTMFEADTLDDVELLELDDEILDTE